MQPLRTLPLVIIALFLGNLVLALQLTKSIEESPLCAENSITDINNLGFKLLNKQVLQQGNVFLSPVGIALSLGILYLSSTNNTAEQIRRVLIRNGTEVEPDMVEDELNQLLQTLRDIERNFSIVNELLFEDCKYVNEEYVRILKDHFVDEVHFVEDTQDEVANRTDRDSDGFLSKTEIANMRVVNSLAFNDSWKVQFLEEKTERDYFYSGRRETTEVWMMSIEAETFKFYEDLEMRYKFIELPYENDHIGMILALPTQYDHPANLQLDTKTFCKIKSKLIPTKLDMVSIPKFQFEEDTNLKEILISIGVEDAFNGSTAIFPGLSADEGFHVSGVKQRITIEVDEDGSKEASITKLKFKPVAFRGVKEFIANHPFLFYVEDKKTGTILLSGRVDEPSESISLSEHLQF